MIRLLMGGSPCTYWSIAQTKNRETEASGLGWELFKNFLIARDKYQPDYFLYENNKSMSAAIRAQITEEFGFEPICINSALVSAQNRQRLYWFGRREDDGTYSKVEVEQPEDRGILLRDILETGAARREKAYALQSAGRATAEDMIARCQRNGAAEPVNATESGKAHTMKAQYYKNGMANFISNGGFGASAVAEPVRIGTIESGEKSLKSDSQANRVYSCDGKSVTLSAGGGGAGGKTGLYAVCIRAGDAGGGAGEHDGEWESGNAPRHLLQGRHTQPDREQHRPKDLCGGADQTGRTHRKCGGGGQHCQTLRRCGCQRPQNRDMQKSRQVAAWTCPCREARQGGDEQ